MYYGTFLVFAVIQFLPASCSNDASRLFEDKLNNYNKLARPVPNSSLALRIQFKLKLLQILDVHEKNQVVTLNGWLIHVWNDYKLRWDPAEYGGIKIMHVPAELIWLPDIILYNNADGSPQVTTMTKAHVYCTGEVVWEPPVIYNSMCQMKIQWFPFDEQYCDLKFGSWTYYGSELDMVHLETDNVTVALEEGERVWNVERGIDISEYQESVEWDLMSVKGTRHQKRYPCCTYPFVDITFYMNIRRKTLFYAVNLITPCVGITFLTSLVFYLPSGSNNKITLCVSILVSLTVFLLLLVEIIPPTSLVIPLIGRYLLFTMILVSVSVCVTVFILNIHYRTGYITPIPGWVRLVFMEWLPKVFWMSPRRANIIPDAPMGRTMSNACAEKLGLLVKQTGSSIFTSPSISIHTPLKRRPTRSDDHTSLLSLGSKLGSGSAPMGLAARLSDFGTPEHSIEPPAFEPEPTNAQQPYFEEFLKTRACMNVCYIAEQLRTLELEKHLKEDWKFVALVIDRVFLLIFSLCIVFGTISIVFMAPMLRDTRVPVTDIVKRELAANNFI